MNTSLSQAQDVKDYLWATYDPHDDLIYPISKNWDLLLLEAMANNTYGNFSKNEVLDILFGLVHRTRIVEGLWEQMFSRGVTQKLLERLSVLHTDKC